MTASKGQVARVRVDFSQYQVAAGPDMLVGDDVIPGLLVGLGPQAVAVLTGLQAGTVKVTAQALTAAPAGLEPGWDVAAETDLDCPEGVISVLDWGGPDHPELGDLAAAGPGRYRLRVHARHRESAIDRRTAEEHLLLFWPAAEPAPPRRLTAMDAHGRALLGEEPEDTPPLDPLERAAASAVRQLAELVNQPSPPALSGELTVVRAQATVPATLRKVWNEVSAPWDWIAVGGITEPAAFDIKLQDEPSLEARGGVVVDEAPALVAFTWLWTATQWVRVERVVPTGVTSRDPITGAVTPVTRVRRTREIAESWMLPPEPTTVHISLHRAGKGVTSVELEHRDLPAELAGFAQPFWEWALQRELPDRLTKAPFYGYPWHRV
jgi:hypothetical protein